MLHHNTLEFLRHLSENNNKVWLDAHRAACESAKANFQSFIESLFKKLVRLEPELTQQEAKNSIYRMNRDVRFSKDKSPYKGHFGAFMSRGGRKYEGAGFYIHVQPGNKTFVGGGLWSPPPTLLKKVRQEIDYNLEEFEQIITSRKFQQHIGNLDGESLKLPPKGYDADNPAISYLKMKSFTGGKNFRDSDVINQTFSRKCFQIFEALAPAVHFMNRAMD